jgi:uncharacterized protein YndB with AHSA1/START domain
MGQTGDIPAGASDDETSFAVLSQGEHSALLRFSRQVACRRRTVWSALTESGELEQWFPAHIEGDIRPGSELTLRNRKPGARRRPALIFHLVPNRILGLTWAGAVLVLEVRPRNAHSCQLDMTWAPGDAHSAPRHAAIWHASLDVLEHVATGSERAWSLTERLGELERPCRSRFGPQTLTL